MEIHTERKASVDVIKSIAIIMVIAVHASSNYFALGQTWRAANFFDSLSRACVPLFFMCTGCLLLQSSDDILKFYKKRVIRLIPAIFVWSVVYLFFTGKQVNESSLLSILYGPTEVHLWFIYAIFGLCLLAPFLKKVLDNSSKTEIIALYLLCFISSSLSPMLAVLYNIHITPNYHLYTFSGYAATLMLGYTLRNTKVKPAYSISLFIASSLAIYKLTSTQSEVVGYPVMLNYEYLSPLVILASASLFVCANCLSYSKSVSLIAKTISNLTLGIYCSHIIFLTLIIERLNTHGLSIWIIIPLATGTTFIFSFILTFIISKIPLINKIA